MRQRRAPPQAAAPTFAASHRSALGVPADSIPAIADAATAAVRTTTTTTTTTTFDSALSPPARRTVPGQEAHENAPARGDDLDDHEQEIIQEPRFRLLPARGVAKARRTITSLSASILYRPCPTAGALSGRCIFVALVEPAGREEEPSGPKVLPPAPHPTLQLVPHSCPPRAPHAPRLSRKERRPMAG